MMMKRSASSSGVRHERTEIPQQPVTSVSPPPPGGAQEAWPPPDASSPRTDAQWATVPAHIHDMQLNQTSPSTEAGLRGIRALREGKFGTRSRSADKTQETGFEMKTLTSQIEDQTAAAQILRPSDGQAPPPHIASGAAAQEVVPPYYVPPTIELEQTEFGRWLDSLERRTEERLQNDARGWLCSRTSIAPHVPGEPRIHVSNVHEFREWLHIVIGQADEASLRIARREQMLAWLTQIQRKRGEAVLPFAVRDRMEAFIGKNHAWAEVTAHRARAVAEAVQRRQSRGDRVVLVAALSALTTNFIHPRVVEAAERGGTHCQAEIGTDELALQVLFEVSAKSHQDGAATLAMHLEKDGFGVESKYHDPEYGLWRGFWVDACDRVRISLWW